MQSFPQRKASVLAAARCSAEGPRADRERPQEHRSRRLKPAEKAEVAGEPGFHPGDVGARAARLARATAHRRPPLRFGSASARSRLRASREAAPPPGMNPGRTGAPIMTRQEGPNRSSSSGRERKRKAGMGWPVQAVREVRPAGRGDSLVPHTSTSTNRADVYSRITAEIIATIERGAGEWRAPWFHNGASVARPTNVASGKRYRGINTLALWTAGLAAKYGDGLWGTYKQWQEAGAQVRQGERSTTV